MRRTTYTSSSSSSSAARAGAGARRAPAGAPVSVALAAAALQQHQSLGAMLPLAAVKRALKEKSRSAAAAAAASAAAATAAASASSSSAAAVSTATAAAPAGADAPSDELVRDIHDRATGTDMRSLSLAQRIGLVDAPPGPMSHSEWMHAYKQFRERSAAGEECCAICQDEFGADERQVLLSCTHSFHSSCIESYERFAGKRCCPMCRREGYEKRAIGDGRERKLGEYATRLQALARGFLCRRRVESRAPTNPTQRGRYYARQLERVSSALDQLVAARSAAIDTMMAQVDRDVEDARAILSQPIVSWSEVRQRARSMAHTECSVCLGELCERACTLLSCAHVFHDRCMGNMERFAGESVVHRCPLCRSAYGRVPWDMSEST